MTGPIVSNVSSGILITGNNVVGIAGGSDWSTSGAVEVHDGINNDGKFLLRANDSSNSKTLEGNPNGSLTWDGEEVITSEGGTINGSLELSSGGNITRYQSGLISNRQNTNGLDLAGGKETSTLAGYECNAYLSLRGGQRSSEAGYWMLYAANNSGTRSTLMGTPAGNLTLDGKEIERVNSYGSNWIRYDSGLQIVFQILNDKSSPYTHTLPVNFVDTTYQISVCSKHYAPYFFYTESYSTSSFKISCFDSSYNQISPFSVEYHAIGYWK